MDTAALRAGLVVTWVPAIDARPATTRDRTRPRPVRCGRARTRAAVGTRGVQWQLTFGPERDKASAWVDCETDELLAQLIVWTSGEAELAARNIVTGVIDQVHHELASPQELSTCLDDLTNRLTDHN